MAKSKTTTKKSPKNTPKKNKYAPWYIAGAVLLLMLSTLSLFVSSNIYNSERFTKKTVAALTSEATREAIATEITSEVLADQSLITQRILAQPMKTIISSLLKTETFSSVFTSFTVNLHRFLVSNDFEPVTINIGSITSTIDSVVDNIKPDNELDLSEFEEKEIVLLEDVDLPPFKTIGNALMIISPLTMLALMVGAVIAYNKASDKRDLLKYSGLVLMISGTILLLLTLTSGSLITLTIIDPERSIIMQEIYNSFISNFRSLQFAMVAFGAILYGIYYYLVNDVSFSVTEKKN